jgi:hypothetical protein
MNSRDRVIASSSHREPERIPIDLSGHRSRIGPVSADQCCRLEGPLFVYLFAKSLPMCQIDGVFGEPTNMKEFASGTIAIISIIIRGNSPGG